jgi:DNA invertase Pin-like site-specific DNA recombinase
VWDVKAAAADRAKGLRYIGYARVSTGEQNLQLQIDALRAAGCDKIFRDKGVSGAVAERPGLSRALRGLKEGDVLVVWRLDRLGRSLRHLIELIHDLGSAGHGFRSLSETIDTGSASGRLFLHMMGALAEFERELIGERTKAGLQAARMRGKRLGRPPAMNERKLALALSLKSEGVERKQIAAACGVSVATLYRALREVAKKGE